MTAAIIQANRIISNEVKKQLSTTRALVQEKM